MIYKMALKDSADEMTFDLLEVPIVDKDIEGAVDNVTLDGNQYTDYLWLKKQFVQKWSILCDDEYTRLRGFYTRQFENADVPSYRLYYGDDIIRNSTLSGERIELSISGVADGTISLTQMDGNTIQDDTPAPSAPVPIETVTGRQTVKAMGKNLIEPIMPSWTYHGVLCTNNGDGSFTLNGTATATATWRISQSSANGHDNMLNLNGTYTLSCSGLQNGVNLIVTQLNVWQTVGAMRGNDTPATFTTNLDNLIVYVAVANGTTVNNVTIRPMLEVGNQATAYEPYKGQNYEINLGKNLWNTTVENGGLDANGNTFVSTTQLRSIGYMEVEPNTEYSFSNTNNLVVDRICYYSGNKTFIERGVYLNVGTFTTPNNGCRYARLVIRATNGSNITPSSLVNAQLEKGARATDYSAYFEPIELCKIGTYQDRIYKENGKWYLHKEIGKITFASSTAWTKHSTTNGNVFMLSNTGFIGYPYNSGHIAQALMDTDEAIDLGTRPDSANGVFGISTGSQLRVLRGTYDASYTADTFKAEMVGHYIYGALATPTDTEITNEALLEELEALQDEAISVGQHSIYTDTPNALPTLTFDLTEYLSQSTTIIPETAVRLTLTDGGVINACGCRKDVQLTMRETIE